MKILPDKKALFITVKNILLTIAGTLILAFGASLFIIPFDLVVGGISSMAIIINKIVPNISVDILISIFAWLLFFLGFLILGKSFALKTLISTIVYPVGISAFTRLVSSDFAGGFLNMRSSPYGEISVIIASLFGGLLIGVGCAVTFFGGGSTGGVDVLALILCKKIKGLKTAKAIFIIDAITIIFGMFIIKDLVISLLGIIAAFISTTVIDRIFLGRSKAFIAQIISEKHEEINAEIINTLKRTTSIIKITGGYSKKEKTMLSVSFGIRQYAELLSIVNRIDESAFITIQQASEINGIGWTK